MYNLTPQKPLIYAVGLVHLMKVTCECCMNNFSHLRAPVKHIILTKAYMRVQMKW